ncbi:MAG: CHASE3 domain-containing protein [Acidobacteriaceae bacterium]
MTSNHPVNLREFNRVLRTTLLLPVALLAVLAGLLVWQIEDTLDIQRQVDQSDRLTLQLNRLGTMVVDQETGMRGFQLTGLPAMLEPYTAARGQTDHVLETVRSLCAAEPQQQQENLRSLEKSLQIWQAFAENQIAVRKAGQQNIELVGQGKEMMDSLRRKVQIMVRTENTHRAALSGRVHERVDRFLRIILVLALAAGVGIGVFTSSRLQIVSQAYDDALKQLREKNEELTASQQLLLTTLESISDGVISFEENGRVRFMNAIAQKLTQWPSAEARGRQLDDVFRVVHDQTRQPLGSQLPEVLQASTAGVTKHALLIARDGTEYMIEGSISPVLDAEGHQDGFVSVFRDVTELRRAEASLISNEKLAVTGRLAASIAHEIHNPLDSVANLHFLLASEPSPAKRAEYLALAQQELSRTLQISRAMLSLYRESQVPVQVNLQELIGSVLLLLDRRLRDQGVSVEQSFTQPTEVLGYPGELRQVFTNLITNAADAAGSKGRVRIQVRPASPQEGRAGVLVEIADNGPGIASHVEKKLFQPFITTKGERGTGLGLWVSLGIVKKHGGTVRIGNNTKGDLQGALVRVYLPEKPLTAESATRPLSL